MTPAPYSRNETVNKQPEAAISKPVMHRLVIKDNDAESSDNECGGDDADSNENSFDGRAKKRIRHDYE